MKVLQLLFLTILFSQPRLHAAEAAANDFQVSSYDSTAGEWEGWHPKTTFDEGNDHVVTLWERLSSAGTGVVSFSLRDSNPAEFECITNPERTDQVTGPNIYWANGYVHYLTSANSRLLSQLDATPLTAQNLLNLLVRELNKISTYNKWLQQDKWTNYRLIRRVFKWSAQRNQWILREDAPNPLLAFELYQRLTEANKTLHQTAV